MIFVYCIYVPYLCIWCSSLIQFPYFIERRDAHVIIISVIFPIFLTIALSFSINYVLGVHGPRALTHFTRHTVQRECRVSDKSAIRCVMCEMSFWKSTANRADEMVRRALRVMRYLPLRF